MTQVNCAYHPGREAIAKCENCHKMLCVACRTVDTIQHSSTSHHMDHSHTTYWATQHEVCPECYYDRRIHSSRVPYIVMIGFGIFFAVMAFGMLNLMSDFGGSSIPDFVKIMPILFGLIGIGISLGGVYTIFVKVPRIKAEAQEKKQEFLDSVTRYVPGQVVQKVVPQTITSPIINPQAPRICQHCGSENITTNEFCGKCGGKL